MKGRGRYRLHLKQGAWPAHSIPLLYLPFSKSFIWEPQGGRRSTMQSEEKFDQVKVRQWVCSIAPGIYEAICSCPPFKWNTKPLWSHRFPLVMGFKCFYTTPLPVRGAPWETCMRDCVVDLILVTKTLERRLKLVLGKQTGCTCKHLFNRKTQFFTRTRAKCPSCSDRAVFCLFLTPLIFL